jgi:hypothetical protein
MGNNPSSEEFKTNSSVTNINPNNIKSQIIEFNQDEIFEKILNVSNKLFEEYNNEFLNDNFCNKVELIYEKKLSNFNIKLLKSLYNNINSNNVDKEISVTLQYLPKNDEKFVDLNGSFKDKLIENFWNKNIEINHSKLIDENTKLKKENIDKIIPNFDKKYIQFKNYFYKFHRVEKAGYQERSATRRELSTYLNNQERVGYSKWIKFQMKFLLTQLQKQKTLFGLQN